MKHVENLFRDERGSVYLEYIVVCLFVGLLVLGIVWPYLSYVSVFEYARRRAVLCSMSP